VVQAQHRIKLIKENNNNVKHVTQVQLENCTPQLVKKVELLQQRIAYVTVGALLIT